MRNFNIPIMFSQITSNVDLRAFAIQIAQSYAEDVDGLIDKAKLIEGYVKGLSTLPETPRNPNMMYEELCKLMTFNSKKEEEGISGTQIDTKLEVEPHE